MRPFSILAKPLTALRCATLIFATVPAFAAVESNGYVELSGQSARAPEPWNSGGTGALGTGDGIAGEARLGLRFTSESSWSGRLALLGRAQTAADLGRDLGLIEGFVDYGDLTDDGFRVRAGLAFSGTSFENVEDFWQTPYTLSLSALNSWIGEEFRPLGVTFAKRFTPSEGGNLLDVSASVYGGNDSSAALLAWRGFAAHNRLSVYGEALPILPLPSLRDVPTDTRPAPFGAQRNDGSKPFGPDLDGRPGFALRARNTLENGAHVSVFFTDNRGDRNLHRTNSSQAEYAWHTRFGQLGFDFPLSESLTLVGEWLRGRTNMGFPPGGNVNFDFDASYLMISQAVATWTLSARVENFHINDLDQSVGERNTQNGFGATLAALRNSGDWRLGFELKYLDVKRPGNAEFLATRDQGGAAAQILVRRYF